MANTLYKKRQEIQQKLFFKFLKKEKCFQKFLNLTKIYPSHKQNLSYGMYDYIFSIYEYDARHLTRTQWLDLQYKWGEIVNNYKKIKKNKYKIYGK